MGKGKGVTTLQFNARLVAPVVRDTFANMAANTRTFGMIYVAATAAGIGLDLSDALGEASILLSFAFVFFQLFLQACIILAILQSGGHAVGSRQWRIASLFGIGIITGFGIVVGLLLLILPGLYLVGRWYIAAPILFAEDTSVSEAVQASWERTEEHWLACTAIALLAFVVQAGPIFASLYLLAESGTVPIGVVVASNALSQGAWVFGIAAAATMYLTIGRRARRSEEIFG